MTTDPNESAFPFSYEEETKDGVEVITEFGLTKREYFAGQAMHAIAVSAWAVKDDRYTPERAAEICVLLADALINQLNK